MSTLRRGATGSGKESMGITGLLGRFGGQVKDVGFVSETHIRPNLVHLVDLDGLTKKCGFSGWATFLPSSTTLLDVGHRSEKLYLVPTSPETASSLLYLYNHAYLQLLEVQLSEHVQFRLLERSLLDDRLKINSVGLRVLDTRTWT